MTATQDHPELPDQIDLPNRSELPDRPELADRIERRARATRSRVGEVWVAMIVAALVLLLLLIFILQNGQRAEVSFLGAHGSLPMGVALLLAAVFGVLLVALPGTARIIQLRVSGRRRAGVAAPAADRPDAAL
jgi:uncharacterized integral membrane protein